jgi:hypothetical protein
MWKNCGKLELIPAIGARTGEFGGSESMQELALPSAVEFVENSARLRSVHYRKEAARFRSMAEAEPLPALRRHLRMLAREYEKMSTSFDVRR